uniref:NADH dehydrogenase subunit 6 n=1 Tax=Eupristina koningsbergeri TaxID=318089 RepID=A0A8A3YGG4_9HYME|nr:NADH dehydrogenase subunit 6 [Eupristina koningsbergeri]
MDLYSMMINLPNLIMMMIMISMNPMKNKHPLSAAIILVLLLMMSSYMFSMMYNTHQYSMILFLIMIGGLLIMFLYFCSFTNNKPMIMINMFSLKNLIELSMLMILYISLNYMLNNSMNWMYSSTMNEISSLFNYLMINIYNNFSEKINFFYNYNEIALTLYIFIFLAICLTVVVKLCMMKKMNLRKMSI